MTRLAPRSQVNPRPIVKKPGIDEQQRVCDELNAGIRVLFENEMAAVQLDIIRNYNRESLKCLHQVRQDIAEQESSHA